MAAISFNPLSTEANFLKNKSSPAVNQSHIGEAVITRTLNQNGPTRANGYRRAGYPTANNAPSKHVRVGRSAKNAMAIRNETRRLNRLRENAHLRGLSELNNNGLQRSLPRNNNNAGANGDLLHHQLHQEGLNVAPNISRNQAGYRPVGKNLKPAPARGALRGSRNKARARNEAARLQAEEAARLQAEEERLQEEEDNRYQVAINSIANNRDRHNLAQEKREENAFIKSQEQTLKEYNEKAMMDNRGIFNNLSDPELNNDKRIGGVYKKRRSRKIKHRR
jgi:hypothetical protein